MYEKIGIFTVFGMNPLSNGLFLHLGFGFGFYGHKILTDYLLMEVNFKKINVLTFKGSYFLG